MQQKIRSVSDTHFRLQARQSLAAKMARRCADANEIVDPLQIRDTIGTLPDCPHLQSHIDERGVARNGKGTEGALRVPAVIERESWAFVLLIKGRRRGPARESGEELG